MSEAVTTRIEEIVAAVDSLLADLSMLSVSASDLAPVRLLVDKTDLLCTHTVSRIEADRSYREDGYRDMGAFMATNCHTLKSEGNVRVKRAALLDALPLFGVAAVDGSVTSAHLQLLANTVTTARLPFVQRDEEVLVAQAVKFDASDFKTVLQRWASLVDDVTGDPTSDDEQYEKRSLQIRQLLNGIWMLQGLLDAATGQVIEAAIEAAMATPTAEDNRSLGQFRHDALADICHESLANEDRPVTSGQRPHVSLVLNDSDGTAHTSNNWYVSTITRDIILCDCVITAVKSCAGFVFDVGKPETQIPSRNRKAVIATCSTHPTPDHASNPLPPQLTNPTN